jgi:hypothetical protein
MTFVDERLINEATKVGPEQSPNCRWGDSGNKLAVL